MFSFSLSLFFYFHPLSLSLSLYISMHMILSLSFLSLYSILLPRISVSLWYDICTYFSLSLSLSLCLSLYASLLLSLPLSHFLYISLFSLPLTLYHYFSSRNISFFFLSFSFPRYRRRLRPYGRLWFERTQSSWRYLLPSYTFLRSLFYIYFLINTIFNYKGTIFRNSFNFQKYRKCRITVILKIK